MIPAGRCPAAGDVTESPAVLAALGKRQGAEDDRAERQRFNDALQLACAPLPRARQCARLDYALSAAQSVQAELLEDVQVGHAA